MALRNMVRKAPIAVAMFDTGMNYLVVSETWLKQEGKSESELIGNNHYEAVPEITDSWKIIHKSVLDGETHICEQEKMTRADGTVQILRWKMNPWYDTDGLIGGAVLFIEDITEKIEVSQTLKASEASLAQAQNLAHMGSWELDTVTQEIHWSNEMYAIHGIEMQPASIELFMSTIHSDDVEAITESVNKAFEGINAPITYRIIRADSGEQRTMYGAGAKIIGTKLIGTVQDITEQHNLEEELKEKEQLFREMAENIEDVFWLTDRTGENLQYMSPIYEKVYGGSLDKIYQEGDAWSDNIHPDDKARVFKAFRSKGELGLYDEKYRIVHEDGTSKWVHARAFPIKNDDGEVVRLAGITRDITEQKDTEERIETLSLVAKETINGVLIHNADGRVIWANNGFSQITGYSLDEIVGLEPWQLLSGAETNQKLIEITYSKLAKGKPFTSDNLLYKKDGTASWITTSFTPILDGNGEVSKIVSIGTDITKQKELEGLQRNMVKRLEEMVRTRTEELETTNDELRNEVWEKQRIRDELHHSILDLKDSILYSKRIQESILPSREEMRKSFADLFVLFLPKDVVSGDFYWYFRRDDLTYFSVIDCTGHGVPGALMSMIANELMNQAIIQRKLKNPGEILTTLNKLMVRTLQQKKETHGIRDGMDLGLCVLDNKTGELHFGGAFSNLYVSSGEEVFVHAGDRHSIGGHLESVEKEFGTTSITLKKGDIIYLTTDGYPDQFGGPDGKKFMKKRFLNLLSSVTTLPMKEQKVKLQSNLKKWKGDLNQVDDILVAGFKY